MPRALAQYLYSGVTTVKSAGDALDASIAVRDRIARGELLGAELFVSGPMFTAEGGHGTEYAQYLPANIRAAFEAQIARTPKTADEARQFVRELKAARVDGLKAILEAGFPGTLFERLDAGILKAIGDEARAQQLPLVVHTGSSRDVADALDAGAAGIEHGPRDRISDDLLRRMKAVGRDLRSDAVGVGRPGAAGGRPGGSARSIAPAAGGGAGAADVDARVRARRHRGRRGAGRPDCGGCCRWRPRISSGPTRPA